MTAEQRQSSLTQTPFGTNLRIGLIVSAALLLILALGPFGYPLAKSPIEFLPMGLLLVNSVVSFFHYLAVFLEKYKKEKQEASNQEAFLAELSWQNKAKKFFGSSYWVALMGLLGLIIGLVLFYDCPPAASPVMRLLLVPFTIGTFLSFACRIDPTKRHKHELKASYSALIISVLIGILMFSLYQGGVELGSFGPAFLQSLTAVYHNLSSHPYIALMMVLSIVGFSHYTAQGLAAFSKDPRDNQRRWQNILALSSFLVSIPLVIAIFITHPIRDVVAQLALSIMTFSACASLASKLGRSLDEHNQLEVRELEPSKSRLHRLINHPSWTYFIRPTLTAGVFIALGFGLFGTSINVQSLGAAKGLVISWALGWPIFSFSLLALSTTIVTNLIFHWLQPSVLDIPTCKSIVSAEEVLQLLNTNLSTRKLDRLLTHLKYAQQLLSPDWRKGLFLIDENSSSDTSKEENYDFLTTILKAQDPQQSILQHRNKLILLFNGLKNSEVDPTYRPPIDYKTIAAIIFGSLLFTACATVLLLIFSGSIALTGKGWSMAFASGCGFSGWLIGRFALSRASGGPYLLLATLSGMAFIVSALLAGFIKWTHFLLNPTLSLPLVIFTSITLLFTFAIFTGMTMYYVHPNPKDRKKSKLTWLLQRANPVIKALLITTSLSLCLIAAANMFSVPEFLGWSFPNLTMTLLASLIDASPLSIGKPWAIAFNLAIFIVSSFATFELMKSFLEEAPSKAEDFHNSSPRKTIFVKLLFTIPIFLLLFIPRSMLTSQGPFSLLAIFGMTAIIIPLLFGGKKLPFRRLNAFFNNLLKKFFQLFSYKSKSGTTELLISEILILAMLTGLAATTALISGASPEFTTPILSISMITTLFFRWGGMQWHSHRETGVSLEEGECEIINSTTLQSLQIPGTFLELQTNDSYQPQVSAPSETKQTEDPATTAPPPVSLCGMLAKGLGFFCRSTSVSTQQLASPFMPPQA